jgi:polysaccharide biosynthesis protein PelG
MAGIGFALRRLAHQETLSSLVAAVGHAAVIAAGPWLFTILSLAFISLLVEPLTGLETLSNFRIVIIYAFAASLVFSAPVTIVATRLVADALWSRQLDAVRPLLLAAYAMSVAAVAVPVVGLIAWFDVAPRLSLALLGASCTVALIWVALSFAGAVRDYRGVTLSFLLGLLVAILGSVGAAIRGLGPAGMVWGFIAGLALVFAGLTARVLATFPHAVGDPRRGLAAMVAGLSRYRHLALGAFLGTAGVWIDKWLFWFSSVGESVSGGLVHAPIYDSAMFLASLAIIPALAGLVIELETGFFEHYQHYYGTIESHGTYPQIEAARRRLRQFTLDSLVLITIAEVGIGAIVVLLAPLIVDGLNLQFRQIAILRYGALGAVFQFVFIASTSLLVFFDRRRVYLGLQLLFLATNAGLTAISLRLGPEFYGVGYFLAALVSSLVAYRAANVTFARLNYLTFIGNNPSIRQATAAARGWGLADRHIGLGELWGALSRKLRRS